MRRLGAVLLFIAVAAAVFIGIFYYAGLRHEQKQEEETPVLRVTVYTDLPQSALQVFDEPFYKETGIHLSVTEMTRDQMTGRIQNGNRPDLYLVSQDFLQELSREEILLPYTSDRTDTVLNDFKDENGFWTGVWVNPAVFAVNTEFADLHPAFSYTWDEVLLRQSVRLVMTDFIASGYSEDGLMSMVEHFGTDGAFDRLRQAAPHIIQYGKYLSTPAHMAAMDKCDIGISGYNEARRVQQEGLPIRIMYPDDGTYFYLYGVGLDRNSSEKGKARRFIDWILSSEDREEVMNKANYYYVYVNDTRMPEDDRKMKFSFWPLQKLYTIEGKKELLDRWVQNIRFGKGK